MSGVTKTIAFVARDAAGAWRAADRPLVLSHFAGLDPTAPGIPSGPGREIVEHYVREVLRNGFAESSRLASAFDAFSNGDAVPAAIRRLYRSSEAFRQCLGERPFERPMAVCQAAAEPRAGEAAPTFAMLALWNEREDLRRAFPLKSAASVLAYYRWFVGDAGVADLFSPYVVARHAQQLAALAPASPRRPARPAPGVQEKALRGDVLRVEILYGHLLGRTPDPMGFRFYREACRSTPGFLRAWKAIGLSAESRARPFLAARMAKALAVALLRVRAGDIPPAPAPSRRASLRDRMPGVYDPEPDVQAAGLWVSDRMLVPVSLEPGAHVRLRGTYQRDPVARQTGASTSRLAFYGGGDRIHAAELADDGAFSVEFEVPPMDAGNATDLVIECSGYFVPRRIGAGRDRRRLSWRLKSLLVHDRMVVDCTREPIVEL